jgi:hypothetical protein
MLRSSLHIVTGAILLLVGTLSAIASTAEYRIQNLVCQPTFQTHPPSLNKPLNWAYASNCSCQDIVDKSKTSKVKIRANPNNGEVVTFIVLPDGTTHALWRREGCKVLDAGNWDCSNTQLRANGTVVRDIAYITNNQGKQYTSYHHPGEKDAWVSPDSDWCYIKQGWSLRGFLGR